MPEDAIGLPQDSSGVPEDFLRGSKGFPGDAEMLPWGSFGVPFGIPLGFPWGPLGSAAPSQKDPQFLSALEKSPCWFRNSGEPPAAADWTSKLTWFLMHAFHGEQCRSPPRGRTAARAAAARARAALTCPQWKSYHAGLETQVSPYRWPNGVPS